MKVFGVSQTSGVERRLSVERGVDGIVLAITDEAGGRERARVLVPSDDLLATVTDPTPGGSTVLGVSPSHNTAMRLGVEIRRNEVWIEVRGGGRGAGRGGRGGRGGRVRRLPGRARGGHQPRMSRTGDGRPACGLARRTRSNAACLAGPTPFASMLWRIPPPGRRPVPQPGAGEGLQDALGKPAADEATFLRPASSVHVRTGS